MTCAKWELPTKSVSSWDGELSTRRSVAKAYRQQYCIRCRIDPVEAGEHRRKSSGSTRSGCRTARDSGPTV